MNKILVIEDEPFIRDAILELLEAENFQAVGAEDGNAGVKLAREYVPDLIICDIMMPSLDGHDVLTWLREDPITANIPFIFLTAKAEKEDLRQGMELGADDYLTKPFTHNELISAIATRLERQAVINKKSQQNLEGLRQSLALSIPHELLTPLHSISGFSTILLEGCESIKPSEIRNIGQQIQLNSERLERLINNYLLYAELEIAATDPERVSALRSRRSIASKDVIADMAIQKAKQVSREADLQLDIQEITINISKADLQKIVEELVDNAFKFSPPGTPVRVSNFTKQNFWTLQVSNSGRGMTTEQIALLGAYIQFERKLYEQEGSGLGLSIVKRITEFYGGEMTVESIPGKQTIVQVTLPSLSIES